MTAAAVVMLFGVSCPSPCNIPKNELVMIEQATAKVLSEKHMSVKPAAPSEPRPTGESASIELQDEATARSVDRLVVLDLEPPLENGGRTLWITHFLRGTAGPWSVGRTGCAVMEGGVFECRGLQKVVATGLSPRKAEDVDLVAALRARARRVGACVKQEDQVPVAARVFGRVEMDLRVPPSGRVQVVAIAPAAAAVSGLGSCLKKVMESIDVGPFEGRPIELKVPLDL